MFNVTRERVRQIEAKTLKKLRHPSRSTKLQDFWITGWLPAGAESSDGDIGAPPAETELLGDHTGFPPSGTDLPQEGRIAAGY
jgi:hypothetical protein